MGDAEAANGTNGVENPFVFAKGALTAIVMESRGVAAVTQLTERATDVFPGAMGVHGMPDTGGGFGNTGVPGVWRVCPGGGTIADA